MAISKRFEKVFKELNFSQVEFAEVVGTKQSIVSRMLSGKVKVSLPAMQILYNKYKINLNWLICGGGKMYANEHSSNEAALSEPYAEYGLYVNSDGWKEALRAKDELIEMQKSEIRRLKVKCGEYS
jgi:transcriptional regulator with XRE-family HTH domain